jgi:hypothetical protein
VQITSPQTTEVTWEVRFEPGDFYHYPTTEPSNLWIERVGLDGVNLNWREQYYLNAGYQVYLDGKLLGYTPLASFPIRRLHPLSNYTARVATVWEDGQESARTATLKFTLAPLVPPEVPLTQLEPLRSTGRWRESEVDEMPSGVPLTLGGKRYEQGLGAFANSEIEYDVKGLYDTFTALVGLDANAGENSIAEFEVVGDGKELWRSGALKKSDPPKCVEVNIPGVRKLVLRTTGEGGSRGRPNRAQADWVEPKILRRTQ